MSLLFVHSFHLYGSTNSASILLQFCFNFAFSLKRFGILVYQNMSPLIYRNQSVGVTQAIGVTSALSSIPGKPSRLMNLLQGNQVINIQITSICGGLIAVGVTLPSRNQIAALRSLESNRCGWSGNQHLVSCILTIPVFIHPVLLGLTFIGWTVRFGYCWYCQLQHKEWDQISHSIYSMSRKGYWSAKLAGRKIPHTIVSGQVVVVVSGCGRCVRYSGWTNYLTVSVDWKWRVK